MNILLWSAAVILILTGLAGTILPMLPGTILVYAGLLLGAWVDDFAKVGGSTLVVLGILSLISFLVDIGAAALGTKSVDASRQAFVGATLGTMIGLFLGWPGLILGPLVGAGIGEWIVRRDLRQAGKAGVAAGLGMIIGNVVRLTLAFVMVGVFILAYFWT